MSISWINALVPFSASYKPLWMAFGALALDLFLAVALTSLARVWLGHRLWRTVHWLAYGTWLLAIVHSLGIGGDRHQAWMIALAATCIAAVVAAAGWRVSVTVAGRPVLQPALAPAARPTTKRVPQ